MTLRSWGHAWMNESFGTYSDYLYHRHDRGDDEGAVNLQGKLAAYLREAKTRYIRPIVSDRYDKPEDMFDSHTYPKGALVLHMLSVDPRRRDRSSRPSATSSTATPSTRSTPPTSSARSRRSPARTSTGSSTSGCSSRAIRSSTSGANGTRPARPSASRSPRSRTSPRACPSSASRSPSRSSRPEGAVTAQRLDPGAGGDVRIPGRDQAAARPVRRGERADQGGRRSPRRRPSSSTSSRHDDVIGRMSAAGELAAAAGSARRPRRARPAAPGAIPSGRSAGPPSRPWPGDPAAAAEGALKQACRDSHSSVRTAAVQALGAFKDKRLGAFYKDLFRKDRSVRVRAEALRALGLTGDASLVPFLRESAAIPSHQNMIRRAAEEALKQLGQ
ncbi:MAG: hypothetical protein MZW92_75855 [Comamonadaceae bacterium]|nr:hypothetical protein [Comamonadaceae bacterium]